MMKKKIIDVSYELFAKKGYDATSVADIIKIVGVSKGGFYHHFKNKAAILETITDGYIESINTDFKELLNREYDDVYLKLNEVLKIITAYKLNQVSEWSDIKKIFTFKDNHTIFRHIAKRFEEITSYTYEEILVEAVLSKQIEVSDPKLLSGLWTREIMNLFTLSNKAIYSDEEYRFFEKTVIFTEQLLNKTLNIDVARVQISDEFLDYVDDVRNKIKDSEVYDDQMV